MASNLPAVLLEEIFLDLDDTADLARASAACASFQRVVSDDCFQRRFRSRHRRPVLGLLENRGGGKIKFYPVQSPRRSALAAGACAEAADFAFSFIPHRKRWRVHDALDGRVLLSPHKRVWYSLHRRPPLLVVGDPLHRRHVEIPPIPGHLLDEHCGDNHQEVEFDPFLAPAPAADDEMAVDDLMSFQVICNALSVTKLVAFAFSSASGQWRAAASLSNPNYAMKLKNRFSLWFRQYAHGCFYWTRFTEDFMLVLDTRETETMEFSIISDMPHKSYGQSKIVVEAAGQGRLGLLLLLDDEDKLELYSRAWQNNGGVVPPEPADEEWRHDRTIPLPAGLWFLSGAAATNGYAFLRWLPLGHAVNPKKMREAARYFTVERLCVLEFSTGAKFLFASFPPPLSSPAV